MSKRRKDYVFTVIDTPGIKKVWADERNIYKSAIKEKKYLSLFIFKFPQKIKY